MAPFILKNCRIFAGGVDLTGASNKVNLDPEVEEKETTNFGSGGWKDVLGGIASSEVGAEGQWEAGDASKVDDASWTNLHTTGIVPWTVCPGTANVGDLAWVVKALSSDYSFGGVVGDVAPWSASSKGSAPVARGEILHPPGTARTATGTGTSRLLGAPSASQHMYCDLHVLSVAGTDAPTITVVVESDQTEGFGTPVARGTFTAATAIDGWSLVADAAGSDNWWRVSWTISGTNPSFLFVVSAGIST